jgi:hypothetical protein
VLTALLPRSLSWLTIPLLIALCTALGAGILGRLPSVSFHSRLERLLLWWLAGLVVLSWVGASLAALGLFRWWLAVGALLAAVALARLWPQRGAVPTVPPAIARTPVWAQGACLLLLLGAGWAYARPAETWLMVDDAAVYAIGGVVLARDGALAYQAEAIYEPPGLPESEIAYWDERSRNIEGYWQPQRDFAQQFWQLEEWPVLARHRHAFYVRQLGSQSVEIGFPPLPKVWAGYAVWLFGPLCAVWAAPFLGLTGLAAMWGLARRLAGWPVALGATLLLGVSFTQVWFSRYLLGEGPTQAHLLAGFYLTVVAARHPSHDRHGSLLAALGALGLAATTLLRVEGAAVVALVGLLLACAWSATGWGRRPLYRLWVATLALATITGSLLTFGAAPYYALTRLGASLTPRLAQWAVGGALALSTAGVLLVNAPVRRTLLRWATGWAQRGPLLTGLLAALWGAWALAMLLSRPWSQSLPGWLVQYWTRPGLALSLLGALCLARLTRRVEGAREAWPLAALGLVFLAVLSVHPAVAPAHPWAMRRLAPVVMPALALLAAVGAVVPLRWAAARLADAPLGPWARRAAALGSSGIVLVLAIGVGQRSLPILEHSERRGAWGQLATLASRFERGDVLLLDDGQHGRHLAPAMEYVFGLPSFLLQDSEAIRSDSPVVDRLIASALAQGRNVYLVVTTGELQWRPAQWRLEPYDWQVFDTPVLQYALGRPPQRGDLSYETFMADVYRVTPASERPSEASPWRELDVPLGAGSYPYLIAGWYGYEQGTQGAGFRWSDGHARVQLPWPGAEDEAALDLCLRLEASSGRPASLPAPEVALEVEGRRLGAETLGEPGASRTLRFSGFEIANTGKAALEIAIVSDTWSPAEVSSSRDVRRLGVMVHSLTVTVGVPCAPGE